MHYYASVCHCHKAVADRMVTLLTQGRWVVVVCLWQAAGGKGRVGMMDMCSWSPVHLSELSIEHMPLVVYVKQPSVGGYM